MEVKSIIFFFSSLFIFSCSLSTINNKEKPNIVFISIDDLNDWVGFLGYDDVCIESIRCLFDDPRFPLGEKSSSWSAPANYRTQEQR